MSGPIWDPVLRQGPEHDPIQRDYNLYCDESYDRLFLADERFPDGKPAFGHMMLRHEFRMHTFSIQAPVQQNRLVRRANDNTGGMLITQQIHVRYCIYCSATSPMNMEQFIAGLAKDADAEVQRDEPDTGES
jgi:hypothetical protein